uniref:Tetratricopeptide repeat protein 29 n=1 Tax=Gouania willdenowi TaxID=441366 RepID=A0A8C5GJ58_GOUWI
MISAEASSSFLPEINQKTQKSQSWSRMKSPQRSSSKDNQLLSIKEIARFRGSVKQQVCVEMLEEGFHRSFSELFSLMRLDCERRALADPSSLLRVHTPLEEQPDKLQVLREHLSRSELAERTASRSVACDQRQLLAQFFSSTEDSWLSVHFYHSCAERGGSRAATEAQACLAELYLQQGDLQRSLQQAELCVGQADDGGALRRRGELLLIRTLTQMAKSLLDQKQHNEALTLLRRAHDIATDIGEKQMEGEASCLLGVAYQSAGNRDMANQFFNSCLQTYNTLQDADGLVRANLARAESLQRQGLIEETIQCLEELIKMCQSNAMQDKLADVCLCLGVLYYNKVTHTHRHTHMYLFLCGIATGDRHQPYMSA